MHFKKNKGIALVLIGGASASVKPDVDNFISLFSPFAEIFLLFTEDPGIIKPGIHYINIKKPLIHSNFLSIGFIIYQFNLIRALYNIKEINKIVFYHTGGPIQFFPQLFSKTFGMMNITFDLGSITKISEYNIRHTKSNFRRAQLTLKNKIIRLIEKLTLHVTDLLIVLSPSMIEFGERHRYKEKIYVANLNFIDDNVFYKDTLISERPVDLLYIGHTGKINPEFLSSTLLAMQNKKIVINFIGNSESLKDWKKVIDEKDFSSIRFLGIKPHNEIPKYLNQAKFLILPSITEGLPKVLLEAMACGTIPIATPVGAIPDVIKHGENGFILSIGSAERMAAQIVKYMNHSNLEEISESAINYIKQNQKFEIIKGKYYRVLELLAKKNHFYDNKEA